MKKFLTLFFVFLANLNIFAASGMMWNQKNLKVSKTKWFDIIYPESCVESASLLYNNADSIYEEISQSYGYPISFRMPVVITPAVENFNAYWTAYPYNHIVLYDTYPIKELEVFSQSLLSTFKHELTHAYTYNLKSNALLQVSKVFGDVVNPGFLFITSGWAEGATLTSESSTGEGRLNNEYAKQMVKQAKIEGEFPLYADVQGSRDLYPKGSFYYFNGAFNEYLQKTFGMKPYADFWYDCINLKSVSVKKMFKNNFGENLDKAWLDFYASVENTQVKANPVKAQIVKDFFEPQAKNFSSKNNSGALYSNLVSSEKGIYFLNQKNGTLYFQSFKNYSDSSKNSPKKLLTYSGIQSFNVSRDGRFVSLSILSSASATEKSIIKIYDTQKKSFFTLKENSVYSPSIIKSQDEYFLIYSSYKSPVSSTNISKLILNKGGKIKSVQKLFQKEWKLNENATNYCDLGNSNFVFLQRSGLSYTFLIMTGDGEILKSYKMPQENMSVRNLAVLENKIYFSFTKDKTLPRSAYFDFDEEKFVLSTKDISGGIFYQTKNLSYPNQIFYTAEFFRQSRIFTADETNLYENAETHFVKPEDFENLAENTVVLAENFMNSENHESSAQNFTENLSGNLQFSDNRETTEISTNQIPSKKYNPFPYYLKGVFYPLSAISSNTYHRPGLSSSYILPYGLTYISSNPWTTDFLTLSAGYGTSTNSFAVQGTFQSGTDTSLFKYAIQGQTEFGFTGWRTSDAIIQISSAIPFGKNSYFTVSANNLSHIGKANKLLLVNETDYYKFGGAIGSDQNIYFYTANSFGVSYSNIRAFENSKYEKLGFSVSPLLYYYFNQNLSAKENYQNSLNLGLNFTTYIPKLLPLKNKLGFTYNLPTKIKFAVLPEELSNLDDSPLVLSTSDKLTLDNRNILGAARLETILFALDIQKALRFLNILYMNDFSISFIYTCALSNSSAENSSWRFLKASDYVEDFKNKKVDFNYEADLRFMLALTPNFGELASSSFRTNFYFDLGLFSNANPNKNTSLFFSSMGIESRF